MVGLETTGSFTVLRDLAEIDAASFVDARRILVVFIRSWYLAAIF